jgi:hypothetical protein
VNAHTINLAKDDNNFTIHFKKKKTPSDSIAIYAKHYKPEKVIFSSLGSLEKSLPKVQENFQIN